MLVGCELSYQHTGNINIGLSKLYIQPPKNNSQVLLIFYILCFTFQQDHVKHQHRTVQIVYTATKQQLPGFINILCVMFYHSTRSRKHSNILVLLNCNFNTLIICNFSRRLRLPEDDADVLKHVAVLKIYIKYY